MGTLARWLATRESVDLGGLAQLPAGGRRPTRSWFARDVFQLRGRSLERSAQSSAYPLFSFFRAELVRLICAFFVHGERLCRMNQKKSYTVA